MEISDWSIDWEESIPNEEDKVQEGTKLDCSVVAGVLGVFVRPGAEIEARLDQVGDLPGFGVGGDGRCSHDGVDNSEGEDFYRLTGGSLMP